jgi:hypothetical protein
MLLVQKLGVQFSPDMREQDSNGRKRSIGSAMYKKQKLYRDAMAFLTPEWNGCGNHLLQREPEEKNTKKFCPWE